MRATTRKELAVMKERIYEIQRDLTMYLDNEQEELNDIPEDSEDYEVAEDIIAALTEAIDNLEDAMDNIQIAID